MNRIYLWLAAGIQHSLLPWTPILGAAAAWMLATLLPNPRRRTDDGVSAKDMAEFSA